MQKKFILAAFLFIPFGINAEEQKFSIAAVADVQYADSKPRGNREPGECDERLRHAVTQWNQRQLDWGVMLGDIIDWDDIDYSKFPRETIPHSTIGWKNTKTILAEWQKLNCDKYLVLGNHDYYVPYKDADGTPKPQSVWRAFGFKDKAYYDFDHKGFKFIVLDGDISINNFPKDTPEYAEAKKYYDSLKRPRNSIWSAAISKKQIQWLTSVLEKSLAEKKPTVIMCHYPIHNINDGHSLFNAPEMLSLLDKFPNVILWLNGHDHKGAYQKHGNRHHLNLKGMQNEAENWYQIDFSKNKITVFQAENTTKPVYELDITWGN